MNRRVGCSTYSESRRVYLHKVFGVASVLLFKASGGNMQMARLNYQNRKGCMPCDVANTRKEQMHSNVDSYIQEMQKFLLS